MRISSVLSLARLHFGNSSATSSLLPIIMLSILLNSCAIPPARLPMDSIFRACIKACSSFSFFRSDCFCSVMSWMTPMTFMGAPLSFLRTSAMDLIVLSKRLLSLLAFGNVPGNSQNPDKPTVWCSHRCFDSLEYPLVPIIREKSAILHWWRGD